MDPHKSPQPIVATAEFSRNAEAVGILTDQYCDSDTLVFLGSSEMTLNIEGASESKRTTG